MVFSGSFNFLKENLLEVFKGIYPHQKTVVITHTNRMKQFLKEYLVSNLGIISNTKFYTLIDVSKKLSQIEPVQDFDRKIIIKKAINQTGHAGFEGLVEEVSDIIQHIKEYKLDVDSLQNDWVRQVYQLYEKEKDGYFDREDTHRIACEVQTDWYADNIIVFGFRTVAPLHRDLFAKLRYLCNHMFAFLPVIQKSGYAENHKSFIEAVEFFEMVIQAKSVHEPEENFDYNINTGRSIYRFNYQNLPINSPNISIFSCQDEEEEVRHVATKIVGLVLNGVSFHQIGIVIPDVSSYIPFIKDIFPRYFIPYYIIEDNRFIDSIPYRQLFNLFKLRENLLSKESVLNLLSQNILKIHDPQAISEVIESAPYLDSLEDWDIHVFSRLKDTSLKDVVSKVFSLPDKASLGVYTETFRYIVTNYVNVQELKKFAEGVLTELENNQLYKKLFDEIGYSDFVSVVNLFFEKENKTTRPNYETVSILSPNTAQGNNFKHTFILNLNAGIFPRTLRDEFLEVIGKNEHILMQQIASFCTLLERDKHIYVSFIKTSVYGRNLSPSFLVNELVRITGRERYDMIKITDLVLNAPQTVKVEEKPRSYKFDFVDIKFPIPVTSFSEYILCPYRFFLGNVLGVHQTKTYDRRIPPHLTGQFVHRLMREVYTQLLSHPQTDFEVIKRMVFDEFEKFLSQQLLYLVPSSRPFEYINLVRMRDNILRFLQQDLEKIKSGKKVINPGFIEREVSGDSLSGKIDRLDTEDGVNVLYDYKTGRLSEKEELQLVMYKKLLEKHGVKVDKLSLVSLNDSSGEYLYTLDSATIKEYVSLIKEAIRDIRGKLFKPVLDKKICIKCEYYEICSGGKE